jgi:hypothetical protein
MKVWNNRCGVWVCLLALVSPLSIAQASPVFQLDNGTDVFMSEALMFDLGELEIERLRMTFNHVLLELETQLDRLGEAGEAFPYAVSMTKVFVVARRFPCRVGRCLGQFDPNTYAITIAYEPSLRGDNGCQALTSFAHELAHYAGLLYWGDIDYNHENPKLFGIGSLTFWGQYNVCLDRCPAFCIRSK